MERRNTRWRLVGLLCAVTVVWALVGCKPIESVPPTDPPLAVPPSLTPTPRPTPSPAPTPVPTPTPTPPPAHLNPLTGLAVDPAYETRRPAAVMLNNLKKALPMYGVTQADILYEALAEGGITRLVGVYQDPSQVPQIGTVRSTRAYYLDIAQGHDAVLLHAGGSPEAYTEIKARGVTNMDCLGGYENTLYWRDQQRIKERGLEHSAFTSGARIVTAFEKLSRPDHEDSWQETLLFADDGTPAGGTSAKTLRVFFSSYKTGLFEYDAATGLYAVSEYGAPFVDGQNDAQIQVTNVLTLYAEVNQIKGDSAGRLSTKLVGGGTGSFACGGQIVPIKWSKAAYAKPFVYTLEDGTPLALGRGRSYINIVPLNTKVETE